MCVKTKSRWSIDATPFPACSLLIRETHQTSSSNGMIWTYCAAPLKRKAKQKFTHFNGILGPTTNPGLMIVD